ncbi:winged helix-turn-helix domain-containing protein [Nautilia sp.]
MKILFFTVFKINIDRFECTYINEENDFYDAVLNKKFDVIVISFDFYSNYLEIRKYVNSQVIFLTEYCDLQIYKKVLEVADYCYLYGEYDKLMLRLEYLRKKILNSASSVYKSGNMLYNFSTNEVYINSEPVKLSNAEKELLRTLIKNRNIYISKEDILMECDNIESESSIKVLISHLRKLGINIENQKNYGYKLKER